jgi:hypothetical protein
MSTISLAAVDRSPSLDRPSFHCPHCGALAQQNWVALGYQADDNDGGPPYWASLAYFMVPAQDEPGDPFGPELATDRRDRWRGAQCHGCQEWSIWLDGGTVYPQRSVGTPAHPDMPGPVRQLYEEAAAVAVVSRRAGAALARAAIERLIKDLDQGAAANAKLNQRIERLRTRVSTPLGQMLDVVRVVGNGALHVDEEPAELVVIALDDTTGPQLLELLLQVANDLVDELITRPRTANSYWDKLPVGIKATIAQQSAAAPAAVSGGQE